MASKLFKDLIDAECGLDGEVIYQGDPIFIVDFETLTIKTCIVKVTREHDSSNFMVIF